MLPRWLNHSPAAGGSTAKFAFDTMLLSIASAGASETAGRKTPLATMDGSAASMQVAKNGASEALALRMVLLSIPNNVDITY